MYSSAFNSTVSLPFTPSTNPKRRPSRKLQKSSVDGTAWDRTMKEDVENGLGSSRKVQVVSGDDHQSDASGRTGLHRSPISPSQYRLGPRRHGAANVASTRETTSSSGPYQPTSHYASPPKGDSVTRATPPFFDLDHQRKQRLAKLSRHLGEEVPPELVYDHSPVAPMQTPSDDWEHGGAMRRGFSLDLSPTIPLSRSKVTSKNLEDVTQLSHQQGKRDHLQVSKEDSRDVVPPAMDPSMSDRQRMINVKRARKMAQVFGSEPPRKLFTVPDMDESLAMPIIEKSDRHQSFLSLSIPSTPTTDTHKNSFPSPPPSIVIEIPQPIPHIAAARPDTPGSPQPFSALILADYIPDATPSSSHLRPPSSHAGKDFSERRRRAAKLQQFFGVGYHAITPELPPSSPLRLSTFTERSADAPPKVEVDIKVSSPGMFWGLADSDALKEADIADVIVKLRGLKAT